MAARVAVGAGAGARATRCPKRRRQPAHVDDGGHMHKVQHRSGGFIMIYEQLCADYQEDQKSANGGVVPEHLKWHEDCCADPCVWEEGDEVMSYMCDFASTTSTARVRVRSRPTLAIRVPGRVRRA